MSLDDATEELKKLLQTLNEARQFKYSAEISTNSKGDMQISVKVRCDDLATEKSELDGFLGEVITIGNKHGLFIPSK